jgi:hypothetical protein
MRYRTGEAGRGRGSDGLWKREVLFRVIGVHTVQVSMAGDALVCILEVAGSKFGRDTSKHE